MAYNRATDVLIANQVVFFPGKFLYKEISFSKPIMMLSRIDFVMIKNRQEC